MAFGFVYNKQNKQVAKKSRCYVEGCFILNDLCSGGIGHWSCGSFTLSVCQGHVDYLGLEGLGYREEATWPAQSVSEPCV